LAVGHQNGLVEIYQGNTLKLLFPCSDEQVKSMRWQSRHLHTLDVSGKQGCWLILEQEETNLEISPQNFKFFTSTFLDINLRIENVSDFRFPNPKNTANSNESLTTVTCKLGHDVRISSNQVELWGIASTQMPATPQLTQPSNEQSNAHNLKITQVLGNEGRIHFRVENMLTHVVSELVSNQPSLQDFTPILIPGCDTQVLGISERTVCVWHLISKHIETFRFDACAFKKKIMVKQRDQIYWNCLVPEHSRVVTGLAWLKNGKLISVSADKTVKIWSHVCGSEFVLDWEGKK